MLCGSAGSKSNLAKAAGPEPLRCEAHVEIKMVKSYFWKLNLPKSAHRCGAKHISKSNVLKLDGLGPLFEVRMWFCVAGAMDSAPAQKLAKPVGFCISLKLMAGMERLKSTCKEAFRKQAQCNRHPHQTCQEIRVLIC